MRHSEIEAYYKCPKYYDLAYVQGLPEPGDRSSALIFGTTMHQAVQAYLEGDDGAEVFRITWDLEAKIPMKYYGRESFESLRADGIVLLRRFERLYLKHLKPQYIETHLTGDYDGVQLSGTVDLAGEYKGVPCVLDFKTSGTRYPLEKLLVSEQLYIYNHLLRQSKEFKALEHVYFVFRKTGRDGEAGIQIINKPVSEQELKEQMDNVWQMVKRIEADKVFPRNRKSCIEGNKYLCARFNQCYGVKK